MYHYICSSSLRPHAFRHIHAASFAQLYAPCYAPQYVHRQLEASCICSVCARMLCIHPQVSSAFYREQKNSAIYRENKKSEKKTEEKRNSYSVYTPQFTTQVSSAIYDAPAAGVPGGAAAAAAVAAAKAPAPAPPVQAPSDKVKAIQASRAEEGLKLLVYEALRS
jgi:hypothetical protein